MAVSPPATEPYPARVTDSSPGRPDDPDGRPQPAIGPAGPHGPHGPHGPTGLARSPTVPMRVVPMPLRPVEPVIAVIGDIVVTPSTVSTPYLSFPLHGSRWYVTDQWYSMTRTPPYAIVLAVLGFCLLTFFSLLFLLIRDTRLVGTVQVTVTHGAAQHVVRVAVASMADVSVVHQQINYLTALAARTG